MKPERIEQTLQDYLDGRLSADERSAFEAELRNDPRLSARVEKYRRIGDALRAPAPTLSPGFYTRAKARFEASHRKEPRWFRVLSWETAGLATAVVLVGALFLPSLFRSELSLPQPADEVPGGFVETQERFELAGGDSETVLDAAGGAEKSAADALEETSADAPIARAVAVAEPAGPTLADEGRIEKKRSDQMNRQAEIPVAGADVLAQPSPTDDRPKGTAVAPPPAALAEGEEAADRPEFAPVPRRGQPESGEDDRAKSEVGGRSAAPLTTQAAMEPAEEQARPSEREVSSVGYVESDSEIFRSPPPNLADLDARPADATSLPAGLVEPGAIRQVTDPPSVERLLRVANGDTDAAATPPETLRLVLIGPSSPPFDCAGASVGRTADGYVVLLRPAGGAADPDAGCAVALPNDSLPVSVHLLQDE